MDEISTKSILLLSLVSNQLIKVKRRNGTLAWNAMLHHILMCSYS